MASRSPTPKRRSTPSSPCSDGGTRQARPGVVASSYSVLLLPWHSRDVTPLTQFAPATPETGDGDGDVALAEPGPAPSGPGRAPDAGVTPRTQAEGVAVAAAHIVPWVLVVLAGAYGVVLRMWLLAHMSLFGDEAVVGLMARGILAGHLDAFYWGQHYGGAEPYVVAAVLGPINGGPMGLNATPAVLAAAASVLVYVVLRTGQANRRLAAVGAALVWVWPYAAVWNSVREIGFRGATLCCGLVLVLCALRVHQHRAGAATRVFLGLAAGAGWWASPEIAYFVVPAIVLLVAGWDRLYAPPSGPASRWSAPWHVSVFALTAVGAIVGALPWLSSNVRSSFASLRLGNPAPPQFGYWSRVCRSSSTTCSPRIWACGRYRVVRGWEGAPSATRSSWSSSSCWPSCWCVPHGWPVWVARLRRCWLPGWPWWPSRSSMPTSPPRGTGLTAVTASICRPSSSCSPSGRCPG